MIAHVFDASCLARWVQNSQTCPLCKAPLPSDISLLPVDTALVESISERYSQELHQRLSELATEAAEHEHMHQLYVHAHPVHANMVRYLKSAGIVASTAVEAVLLQHARVRFVAASQADEAALTNIEGVYDGTSTYISGLRETVPAPEVHDPNCCCACTCEVFNSNRSHRRLWPSV